MEEPGYLWGVKCNVSMPTAHARTRALAWVQLENTGSGGERIAAIIRARDGRLIKGMWYDIGRFTNFRVGWIPPPLRDPIGAAFHTRAEAEACARRLEQALERHHAKLARKQQAAAAGGEPSGS